MENEENYSCDGKSYICPECNQQITEKRILEYGEEMTGEKNCESISEMTDPDDYIMCPECGSEILVCELIDN